MVLNYFIGLKNDSDFFTPYLLWDYGTGAMLRSSNAKCISQRICIPLCIYLMSHITLWYGNLFHMWQSWVWVTLFICTTYSIWWLWHLWLSLHVLRLISLSVDVTCDNHELRETLLVCTTYSILWLWHLCLSLHVLRLISLWLDVTCDSHGLREFLFMCTTYSIRWPWHLCLSLDVLCLITLSLDVTCDRHGLREFLFICTTYSIQWLWHLCLS